MEHKLPNSMKQNYPKTPRHLEKKKNATDALIAEMLLEKSLRTFRKEQIMKEIDISLAERNKTDFLRLVKELEEIS